MSDNILGVYVTRFLRMVLAVAVGGLGVMAADAMPAAADQCVLPGSAVVPVPWPQQMLAVERVWPMTTGAGQRVAVIGTGVADNPQLVGRIAEQTDLVSGEAPGQATTDCLGIGTAVAGIIAAQHSDGVGFHGLAPDAEILSAKVVGGTYPANNSIDPDTLAAAINWAVDRHATVIEVATITYQDSPALRQAVQRANTSNIVTVAPTGDVSQGEQPGLIPYPAAYDGVLGVGAIGQDGTVAASSRASDVSVVAPGADLVTTYPGSGLGPVSGTAFAAGYVAGTVALIRTHWPQLSNSDIVKRLLATATPAREGIGSTRYGNGIVNPYQAVLDQVVNQAPAKLPALTPDVPSAQDQARQAAREHSDTLAYGLAGAGAALAVLLTAIVAFGVRGRRRHWRAGLAPVLVDRPGNELPAPPTELFADRPKPAQPRRR